MATEPRAALAVEIRSWLPGHTHQAGPGSFDATIAWTWTTPAGTWHIEHGQPLLAAGCLSVYGPYGRLLLGPADADGVRRLHAVLAALDAITPGPPDGGLDTEIHGADTATVTIRCGGIEHAVEFAADPGTGVDATLLVEGLSLVDAPDGTYRPADGAAAGVVRVAGPVRSVRRRALTAPEATDA